FVRNTAAQETFFVALTTIAVDQADRTLGALDLDRKGHIRGNDDEQVRHQLHVRAAIDRYPSRTLEVVVDRGRIDHSHLGSVATRNEDLYQRHDVDLKRPHEVVEVGGGELRGRDRNHRIGPLPLSASGPRFGRDLHSNLLTRSTSDSARRIVPSSLNWILG